MTRAERYQIVETIQQGLVATSYKAHDRVLDRPVLLKVLLPRLQADADLVQRFRREALLQARLKHPNVVTVYDFGDEQNFFIASEYVEGQTLESLLKERGRLDLKEAAAILLPVSRALKYAHDHGVIHRDLKPANILLPNQGEPKLADFGLACARDFGTLTAEGCVIGTPAYMSPEQARGLATDSRTDLFSLGILLYETLTGGNPFAAANHADALSRILTGEPPDIRTAVPNLPEPVAALIHRMLAKNREHRLADIAELITTLKRLPDKPADPTEAEKTTPTDKPRLFRTRYVLTGATLAGLLVIALVLTYRPKADTVAISPRENDSNTTVQPVAALPDTQPEEPDTVNSLPETPAPQPVPSPSVSEPARTVSEPARTVSLPARTVSEPARTVSLPARLASPVRLTINVNPWAELLINGRSYGTTPLADPLSLMPGGYQLVLRHPGFPELVRAINLTDPMTELWFDLEREFALVELVVNPWAVIMLDGTVVDTTPLARPLTLPPGEHTLTLTHPELGARVETIVLDSAGRYRFSFEMTR